MGYSVYLLSSQPTTESTGNSIEVADYTYNVRDMLNKAFGVTNWTYIDGMNGYDACKHIIKAYQRMVKDPEEYIVLNPENGWGDYEGCKKFLFKIYEHCALHESLILQIA